MGTFDIHSDVSELEPMRPPAGLAALGLFTSMGSWTSAYGRTGYVPDSALVETYGSTEVLAAAIERLIAAGLWKREGEGYRMLRGPHSDPHMPLPLWRYSDEDLGGQLLAVDNTPNN